MATKAAELYDEDFYAWTQQQAQALRTHFQGDNRLDVEHLAEEIEDLGKSELQAVESYVQQIMTHLLKLDYSGFDLPRRHWCSEIVAFRASMHRKMSPSVRRAVRRALPELYESARNVAAASLDAEPDLGRRLPKACPYDWDAIVARDVLAERGIDLAEPAGTDKRRRRGRMSDRGTRALDSRNQKNK
jgi:Domain of unknown function DUF29